ncbi:Mur ligase family protein [Cyclobacteriaceae bacterium]|nr:Mur ligase family protein [Cyclobacteriaceae bacterium]
MGLNFNKIHFIAIGGSIMHNLALALKKNGIDVSGSDDNFFEPSLSNLKNAGILPDSTGWDPSKITTDLDCVIVGMHAKQDNPELLKAQELGVKVYSFPDFINEQSKHKQRVVISGSHGKTTITSMIMHVLKENNRAFDYLVGAQLKGFDTMVQLSDAPLIIVEGDEYATSPLDNTPKFLKYNHHITLISGIAWDHANVFPTMDDYVQPFEKLVTATPKAGSLIYNEDDSMTTAICESFENSDIKKFKYSFPKYEIKNEVTYIYDQDEKAIPLKIFGQHNLANLSGAKLVCNRIGITDQMFYEAIQTFEGAGKRLELMGEKNGVKVYKDFAHAPSKLAATFGAVKEQFAPKEVIPVYELHTFSSFDPEFLAQYKESFQGSKNAIVLLDDEVKSRKGNEAISDDMIKEKFNNPAIKVIHNQAEFKTALGEVDWSNKVLLVMSSGGLTGLTFDQIIDLIN